MTPGCPERLEELELFSRGESDEAALEAHVRSCAGCAEELRLLAGERELVRRWSVAGAGRPQRLWEGVEKRLRRRRFAVRGAFAAAMLAAAAALLVAVEPRREEGVPPPSAEVALERAETDVRRAIDVLETQLAARGPLPPRPRLSILSAADSSARVRRLEGYTAYLRSLRRELAEEP